MAHSDPQKTFEWPVSGSTMLLVGAALLILMGIVFQLGEIGYAHFTPDTTWVLSVSAEGVWNLLSALLRNVAPYEFLRFWPLLLVTAGCAIVLALNPGFLTDSIRGPREEKRYGR